MKTPDLEKLKTRVIESAELDQRHLLRPLLLFMGSQSEGRIRSLFNLTVAMMDAEVDNVPEAVKLGKAEDFRHLCGLHVNPQTFSFSSILSRLYARKDVADHVPGLWEYVRYLGRRGEGNGPNGNIWTLEPIETYALRVRSSRDWRLMPDHLRPALPEFYPYISAKPTEEHEMLLAVDAIVPKNLPNSMRCDLCQDMIVAVLSGETTVENLKGDRQKYMTKFWRMYPDKYGHLSLDGVVPGTTDLRLRDRISNKDRRI